MSPLCKKNEERKYADVVIEVFEIMMGKKNMFKNEINIDLMKKSTRTIVIEVLGKHFQHYQ